MRHNYNFVSIRLQIIFELLQFDFDLSSRIGALAGIRGPIDLGDRSKEGPDPDPGVWLLNLILDETSTAQISYRQLECRSNALARAIACRARATGRNRDGDFVIAVCMQPNHKWVHMRSLIKLNYDPIELMISNVTGRIGRPTYKRRNELSTCQELRDIL